jgi:Transposase DDE domain
LCFHHGVAAKRKPALSAKDLSRWKLLADFQARLEALAPSASHRTFEDPRRKLTQEDYLSLLLFALFNPVVDSMRGLCAATALRRVQQDICNKPVSLGSFSEAQAVVDPALLEKVFHELAAEHYPSSGDARLAPYQHQLLAIDGTVWRALPRMAWAIWRYQHGRESALKLHVKFNLLEQKPVAAVLTKAQRCERGVLSEHFEQGQFYVGDRYYGEHYGFFAKIIEAGCSFVLRLRQEAVFEVLEHFALSQEDRVASVTFDGMVRVGARPKEHALVRLVRVQTQESEILLVTDKAREELSAELIALIYSYRWRIELFFKWLKCILGCRHWLAESQRGVALQIYCALIAALLLLRYSGARPNKRAMEMIRFYLEGMASLDELTRALNFKKKSP